MTEIRADTDVARNDKGHKRYPESRYVGVELEIKQALVDGKAWPAFKETIVESLGRTLA
jgi:hypothetical protein